MLEVIIGNICSLLAMLADSFGSTRKKAKEVLLMQAVSQGIYCIGSIVLKGYSAAVQNVIGVIRNLIATRKGSHKAVEWILIVLGVALGIVFNNRGWLGWFPILANLEYSLAIYWFKDNEYILKITFAVYMLMYTVFNLCLFNFVGFIANMVVILTTVTCIIRDARDKKASAREA